MAQPPDPPRARPVRSQALALATTRIQAPAQSRDPASDDPRAIEALIVGLLAQRGPLASICPSEVARALAPQAAAGPVAWRTLMPQVREVAQRLAERQQVRLTRQGEPVEAADLHRGILRIRRGALYRRPGRRP